MTDSDDATDLELQPPAKRGGMSRNADAIALDNEQFWFQDGDIVLGIEDNYIKIHRHKLMVSLIFATMFELPQPERAESSLDGCPVVRLPYDTFHDWIPVLDWMYNRSWFELRYASLDRVGGALRVSTKYEILELRRWCKQQLLSRWPLRVSEMTITGMVNAAEAICLARECDVPEILPAAFYALSVQRWENDGDGGQSHLILSPDDLRRVIVGRERLHRCTTSLLANWDPHTNTRMFSLCNTCRRGCMNALAARLLLGEVPYVNWLFRDLDWLSKFGFPATQACCDGCRRDFRRAVDRFLANLEEVITTYFIH